MSGKRFYERFLAFARKHALLKKGERVLVAVSGGPDSITLADCLKRYSRGGKIELVACHLNHLLRGSDSDEDEMFVRDFCRRMKVAYAVTRQDVARAAKEKRTTIEAAAREARYDFYRTAARHFKAGVVATGHTMSDNAETILQRLIEGAGFQGLAGIPVSRPLARGSGLRVVRPLLFATRADVEAYAASRGLPFRVDKTNLEPIYLRNRIRLEILPALRDLNPSIEQALLRVGDNVGALLDFVEAETGKSFRDIVKDLGGEMTLSVSALLSAPEVIAREVVRLALLGAEIGGRELAAAHVDAVMKLARGRRPSARLELPNGLTAQREYDKVTLIRQNLFDHSAKVHPLSTSGRPPKKSFTKSTANDWSFERPLAVPGRVTIPHKLGVITAKVVLKFDKKAFIKSKGPDEEMVDADVVDYPLFVRRFRQGDRFRPLGAPGARKVSDFLADAKVPLAARASVVVVADAKGIIWVAGFRIADRVKITDKTKAFLHLSFRRET